MFMGDESSVLDIQSDQINIGEEVVFEGDLMGGIVFSFFNVGWSYKDSNSIWINADDKEDYGLNGIKILRTDVCSTGILDSKNIFGVNLSSFECQY